MKLKTAIALAMSLIFSMTALNVWSCGCNTKDGKKAKSINKDGIAQKSSQKEMP